MGAVYGRILKAMEAEGWAPPRRRVSLGKARMLWVALTTARAGLIHIVGAGLAGLSAAVTLAGRGDAVSVIEASAQAGGRCRSYFDAVLGMTLDNGNHLVLSGNHATFDYLRTIGSADRLVGPDDATLRLLRSARRRALDASGPIPARRPGGWPSPSRRVPGHTARRLPAAAAAARAAEGDGRSAR